MRTDKTFLLGPKRSRLMTAVPFVVREPSDSGGFTYWLGVYHDYEGPNPPRKFDPARYRQVVRIQVSQEFYEAALTEAERQS